MNPWKKFITTFNYCKSDIRDMGKYSVGVWERFEDVWPDILDFLEVKFIVVMMAAGVYLIFIVPFIILYGSFQEIPDLLKKILIAIPILLLFIDLLDSITRSSIKSFWESLLYICGYEVIAKEDNLEDEIEYETFLDTIIMIFNFIFWIVFIYSMIFFFLLMIFNNSILGFELAVVIMRILIVAPFIIGFILLLKALIASGRGQSR